MELAWRDVQCWALVLEVLKLSILLSYYCYLHVKIGWKNC
jgi:hypothetical protein